MVVMNPPAFPVQACRPVRTLSVTPMRAVVTSGDEAAAGGDDVHKWTAVDADFQHPAVESALSVVSSS